MNVIYDIGSNNGDDLRYYLLKANKAVAVEANPMLCEKTSATFIPKGNTIRQASDRKLRHHRQT